MSQSQGVLLRTELSFTISPALPRWILISVFLLGTLAGLGQFHLWDQVLSLQEAGFDTAGSLLANPHGLRFILMMPVFILSGMLGVQADWLFSQVVALVIIATVRSVRNTAVMLAPDLQGQRGGVAVFAALILVSCQGTNVRDDGSPTARKSGPSGPIPKPQTANPENPASSVKKSSR